MLIVLAVALLILLCSENTSAQPLQQGEKGDILLFEKSRMSPFSFDRSGALIPLDQIVSGGPGKDGIPALSQPQFIPAAQANRQFSPNERVVGVVIEKETRAYPLSILNWHECVNDTVGGIPLAVTYCPLCDSVAVFERRIGDEVLEFGISGLLYNSNVLLYDRAQDRPASLWSQVKMMAVTGPRAGQRLKTIPAVLTTWSAWQREHPETLIQSRQTGYQRDYHRNPYEAYFRNRTGLMFPVEPLDRRRPPKERVLGICLSQECKAYPERDLAQVRELVDKVAGQTVRVRYDRATRTIRLINPPAGASTLYAFWFSWAAMHPETALFEPARLTPPPKGPQARRGG